MEDRLRLVPEDTLTDIEHDTIKRLLVAAFPQYADIFSAASYWGARPEYRLWMETADGEMLAHLDFGRRMITVGDCEITVAGVSEVATHPDWQGRGVGRQLMAHLRMFLQMDFHVPFGFLNCREAVVGFYTSAGWHRVPQSTRFLDPDTNQWTKITSPAMILPAFASESLDQYAWPSEGLIDLRGLPW